MKDKFTQGQLIGMIKEQESKIIVFEIWRQYDIETSTFFNEKDNTGA